MLTFVARALAGSALRRGQAMVGETFRQLWLLLAALVLLGIGIAYGLYAGFTLAAAAYGTVDAAAAFAAAFVLGGIVVLIVFWRSSARGDGGDVAAKRLDELVDAAEIDRLMLDVGKSLGREASPLAILAVAALAGFVLGRR